MKNEKIIKITAFSVMGMIAISMCIAWFISERKFRLSEMNKRSTYSRLSNLTERIIGAYGTDSLANWDSAFSHEFYDVGTIPPEDSSTLLAMRRFKFELHDKLDGMINILDSAKLSEAGQDLIFACQLQIFRISKAPKEIAENN